VREIFEETGLHVRVRKLAYVSESYDGHEHFINATFIVACTAGQSSALEAPDRVRDHVTAVVWVPVGEIASRMIVAVVREPLLAYLRAELPQRYAGYRNAGVTIRWPGERA
jgi:ADP-ribose pyrophosphatase YjhB (NUDIX family)